MNTVPRNIPFRISSSDPVESVRAADRIVVGQLGQTLDGCIATSSGESKYINGDCGLGHLHALRAAVDAVIVGVGSVITDNPSLTVRLCEGPQPVRVVVDPKGRIPLDAEVFQDAAAEVVVVTSNRTRHPARKRCTVVSVDCDDGHISPSAIIARLQELGFNKLLLEGGSNTLSRFMAEGVVDRLHLIMAPMILGDGIPGLSHLPVGKLSEAMRPEVTLFPLGGDIVFDCNFSNCNRR